MNRKTVHYRCRKWEAAATIYFPSQFDKSRKYPAIICAHPISSCKEQTSGLYAAKLAEHGYITLAFDASTQGESGGAPRFEEDPALRVGDFRWAADYLTTLDYIDAERIGVLGICGGGGYAVHAAMTERRIKAVATVAAVNYGRLLREGDLSPDAAIKALEALCRQRTAEARGAEPSIGSYILHSEAERREAAADNPAMADIDICEAVDYYTTPRGRQPGAPNRLRQTSIIPAYTFDAFHLVEHLLTQPLLVIAGGKAGGFGSYRDAYELYDRAASKEKNLYIIDNVSHYELYDRPEAVGKAMARLSEFFGKYL